MSAIIRDVASECSYPIRPIKAAHPIQPMSGEASPRIAVNRRRADFQTVMVRSQRFIAFIAQPEVIDLPVPGTADREDPDRPGTLASPRPQSTGGVPVAVLPATGRPRSVISSPGRSDGRRRSGATEGIAVRSVTAPGRSSSSIFPLDSFYHLLSPTPSPSPYTSCRDTVGLPLSPPPVCDSLPAVSRFPVLGSRF
jgi:hypothetical protein